jgi:hypothetical protein
VELLAKRYAEASTVLNNMLKRETQYRADFFEEQIEELEGKKGTTSAKELSSLCALKNRKGSLKYSKR